MRKLTLRSRLALLSAVAVAVAIAAVTTASWFVVRDRFYNQVDASISSDKFVPHRDGPGQNPLSQSQNPCDALTGNEPPLQPMTSVQFLKADGTTCKVSNSTAVTVTDSDKAVAAGTQSAPYWRNGTDINGYPVRIMVDKLPGQPGWAIVKSQPLSGIEDSLTSLAWIMLAISGFGIAGAATVGLLIARAALRPVDRLTAAVEYVARTENLAVRIPVNGDDEIARLGRAFNKMTRALYASRDEQKRLIDDAGHELRTPLTSLRTTIDLLIRSDETGRPLPEATRTTLLTGARSQMRELSTLIRDLLDLSQPEQSRTSTTALEPVDFLDVVERAVERVRPRGAALAEPVSVDASLKPWFTRGDDAGLERAVVNLLDNAIKFSPGGGTVEVSLHGGALTVRDHGPGIDASELPHVFERFWRSPSARAMPGSGLGLAIAARAVKAAGGEISLEPAADGGTGTVARITLPGSSDPAVSA